LARRGKKKTEVSGRGVRRKKCYLMILPCGRVGRRRKGEASGKKGKRYEQMRDSSPMTEDPLGVGRRGRGGV